MKSGETGYDADTHGDGSEGNPYKAIENTNATNKEYREANYSYGTGEAITDVYGGRIHNAYGGSNEKGNIRRLALSTYETQATCDLIIDNTYNAGKNADIDGEARITIDCVDYAESLYAGSTDSDINSDIHLTITNGVFGKVFGGNNLGGKIKGSITINIKESGCKPIIIDELYAGGNQASYSIYGYNSDGSVRTKEQFETHKAEVLAGHESDTEDQKNDLLIQAGLYGFPKDSPLVNVISATKIGKIFGGGYLATTVGDPTINVNMEQGQITAKYAKGDYLEVGEHDLITEIAAAQTRTDKYTIEGQVTEDGPDKGNAILKIGTIGDIYGGGNLASVIGDTHVEIGTGKWLNQSREEETLERNAATITGNVFGGGKGEALESGARAFFCEAAMVGADGDGLTNPAGGTSVTIGNGTVGTLEAGKLKAGTGNVYGGGEIGRVEKNTIVTIGLEGEVAEDSKFKPVIEGNVFGAGKGLATHGYSALVRGNSTVTIQGKAKVKGSVYGGGQLASVGRYKVKQGPGDPEDAPADLPNGMPYSLASETSGNCTVIVRDNAEIGPDNILADRKSVV